MSYSFPSFSNISHPLFPTSFLKKSFSFLTPQQQKITALASVIFVIIGAYFTKSYFFSNSSNTCPSPEKKINIPDQPNNVGKTSSNDPIQPDDTYTTSDNLSQEFTVKDVVLSDLPTPVEKPEIEGKGIVTDPYTTQKKDPKKDLVNVNSISANPDKISEGFPESLAKDPTKNAFSITSSYETDSYHQIKFIQDGKETLTGHMEDDKFNDTLNGKGRIENQGFYSEGNFTKGRLNGYGELDNINFGIIRKGNFVNDKLDGEGTQIYHNGSIFKGTFKDGFLIKGKITYLDGKMIEGDFKWEKLNGKGKITYPDGTMIEGDFEWEKLNGKGKITYPDGKMIEGDFKNDVLITKSIMQKV